MISQSKKGHFLDFLDLEGGDRKHLWNVGNYLLIHTAYYILDCPNL
jgi:hypothetical protein